MYNAALLGSALAVCDHEASWDDVVEKRVNKVLGLEGLAVKTKPVNGYDIDLYKFGPWPWKIKEAGAHAALRGNAKALARLLQASMSAKEFAGKEMLTTSC